MRGATTRGKQREGGRAQKEIILKKCLFIVNKTRIVAKNQPKNKEMTSKNQVLDVDVYERCYDYVFDEYSF